MSVLLRSLSLSVLRCLIVVLLCLTFVLLCRSRLIGARDLAAFASTGACERRSLLGKQPRSTSRPIATISPAESQSRNWRLCLFSDLARSTAPTGGMSHVLLDELVLVARHWPVRCSASSRACSIRSIVTFIISPHITSPNLIIIPPATLHQVIITSPHQYIVASLTPRKPYTPLVPLR